MKNNTSNHPTTPNTSRHLEFITVFGISLLFTFAGLHFMKMEAKTAEVKTEIEAPYVTTDQVTLPTLSLENLAEAFRRAVH